MTFHHSVIHATSFLMDFRFISDFSFKVAWFFRYETVGDMVFYFPFDFFKFRLVFVSFLARNFNFWGKIKYYLIELYKVE